MLSSLVSKAASFVVIDSRGLFPGVPETDSRTIIDEVKGSFAYVQLNRLFRHREHCGVRRSQRSFAFAHALQDLRRVARILFADRDCRQR